MKEAIKTNPSITFGFELERFVLADIVSTTIVIRSNVSKAGATIQKSKVIKYFFAQNEHRKNRLHCIASAKESLRFKCIYEVQAVCKYLCFDFLGDDFS